VTKCTIVIYAGSDICGERQNSLSYGSTRIYLDNQLANLWKYEAYNRGKNRNEDKSTYILIC